MGLYTNQNFAAPLTADLVTWPNTVGGRIMAALAVNNAETLAEMNAVIAEFQNIGWTWNPNIGGRSAAHGRALLDLGIAAAGRQGECGFLAHALNELLATPAPYGFGVTGAVTATYAGIPDAHGDDQGFISHHVGIHHNLAANMSLPHPGGIALTPMYKWGDHVVVLYLGRFWDPSYNLSYANLQGMADAFVHQMEVTPVGVDMDVSIRCRPIGGGADAWYRGKKPWEVTLPHLPVGGWIGPSPARVLAPAAPRAARQQCCVIL